MGRHSHWQRWFSWMALLGILAVAATAILVCQHGKATWIQSPSLEFACLAAFLLSRSVYTSVPQICILLLTSTLTSGYLSFAEWSSPLVLLNIPAFLLFALLLFVTLFPRRQRRYVLQIG